PAGLVCNAAGFTPQKAKQTKAGFTRQNETIVAPCETPSGDPTVVTWLRSLGSIPAKLNDPAVEVAVYGTPTAASPAFKPLQTPGSITRQKESIVCCCETPIIGFDAEWTQDPTDPD